MVVVEGSGEGLDCNQPPEAKPCVYSSPLGVSGAEMWLTDPKVAKCCEWLFVELQVRLPFDYDKIQSREM